MWVRTEGRAGRITNQSGQREKGAASTEEDSDGQEKVKEP